MDRLVAGLVRRQQHLCVKDAWKCVVRALGKRVHCVRQGLVEHVEQVEHVEHAVVPYDGLAGLTDGVEKVARADLDVQSHACVSELLLQKTLVMGLLGCDTGEERHAQRG